jgi:hypothetical protein
MEEMTIKMTDVKSSNVAAHGYDEATKTLAIRFKGGGLYNIAGVPKELYDKFCGCESFGRFFQGEVRGKYKAERQPEEKK